MKRFLFFLIVFSFQGYSFGQDSLKTLDYDWVMEQVMKNHPFAYQAEIVKNMGDAQVLQARGAFDPKLSGNLSQKYFDGKQYYSHGNGALKVPTWFGLSAETGYTLNDGVYLNPEQRVPNAGLWYAGLRLELGNGLIIDQRRAELAKAKRYAESSVLERTILLNELKRDASIAYWKWNQAYQELQVYRLAYDNATIRLNAVKESVTFGDRPAIDTVEAAMIARNWKRSLLKAQTYFDNAELGLELYLWADGFTPLDIDGAIPSQEAINARSIPLLEVDSLIANHPYLQINDLQMEMKRIDLALKKEQLKPQLTLKYNALSEPINDDPFTAYSTNNYNWGATLSYPILSRKERGGVQLATLKLQDQEMKNTMNTEVIKYKVNSALNNYLLSLEQLEISKQLVENSEELYSAEKSLFELGESSVFMINSRESTWLKAQVENISVENESKMLQAELRYQLMVSER